jgi:DMSO/TMAO reductase YedYZ molybdopterin-dependent catalytic subunit
MVMMEKPISRKDQENAMRKAGRLPPGQSLTQKFPVLHYGEIPGFDAAAWRFKIYGEVAEQKIFTWEEFNRLPRRKIVMDIHCVTTWSKFDTEWEGVSLRDLVDQKIIQPLPEARFVIQHAEFGFSANLPFETVLQENFLLATHFNGAPLSPDHGYPLRAVIGAIPGRADLSTPYFWKGAKWLRGLEFVKQDKPGFWEQAGYHNRGDVWMEERYG